MNLPETIQVTIPAQDYDSDIYEDPQDCYIARGLKTLGYTDINILGHGLARIEEEWYKPKDNFNADTLKQNFRSGIDTTITLIKQ